MKLDTLEIGKDAVVASVASDDQALRQHILDMGLTPGTEVTMMKYAPMGDPLEIRLRGYELTLRKDDAARIELVGIHDTDTGPRANAAIGTTEHPALGEGTYSPRAAKTAVPEGAPLHFALAGNQNCGKTTLFNQLTGSNQHVGNFPGVTVDRKDGTIRNHPEASVTDLPGIYSLSPYTGEEIVSRQFILDEDPDAIIDIIDATNIERNLYLTLQLMELDRPMVIALNMMDEVTANGGAVDVNLLESLLGVPVVPISAARNEGIGELVDHALHVARFRERPGRLDFCAPDGPDGGALHRCIHGIANLIEDHAATAHIPVRFAATKLVEGDELVTEALHLDRNELDAIEHIIAQMEGEAGTDCLSALADMRFGFIGDVCGRCVVKPHESREHVRSVKIDRILTGRYTAIPAFLVIMGLVFWLTFGVIGAALQGLMEDGIAAIAIGERVKQFRDDLLDICNYIETAETKLPESSEIRPAFAEQKTAYQAVQARLLEEDWDSEETDDVVLALTDLKKKYIAWYMVEHKAYRLDHAGSQKKGTIQQSTTWKSLIALKGIHGILPS